MRERIAGVPVVVQRHASRRRAGALRGLWVGAEAAVTLGVVVLLLVVHQLWWTNREARAAAGHKVQALEREWGDSSPGTGTGPDPAASGAPAPDPSSDAGSGSGSGGAKGSGSGVRKESAPSWDQAFAVIRIPKLGVVAPIAQGVGKQNVLNKGYVGHYVGTALAGQPGNFALAGHRNTHGEPFRYINRLSRGDTVVVETRTSVFTYVVDKGLPQTSSRDGGVIAAVPRSIVKPSYGYSAAGHYLTLTTCTPEYTSKYRLVVWAKLQSTRPR
ncbi:class E sortase [Streptomyces sp. NBC_01465]|uniref:class E sortase n=1 Tax=Streptomyces sp. NBC_01465 TaxID=2903878 RepID=UPI002E360E43|nr:class E sortase [Streptomyces sp. NBC_01465]